MPETGQNTKQRISKTQLYTVIGLIVLIIAIPFTVAALRLLLNVNTGAETGKEPQEIVVSNVSESSVTISWVTGIATQGQVKYGTSESNLDLLGSDIRDVGNDTLKTYREHIVEIKSLSPSTQYFYQVINDGTSATTANFKTHAVSESVALPKTLKGKISAQRAYALVYVFASNNRDVSEVRSTYTSSNGTFTYDISDLRTADGSTDFPTTGVKLVTYVNGIEDGKARVIHALDADPGTITLSGDSRLAYTTDVDINASTSGSSGSSGSSSGGSSSGSGSSSNNSGSGTTTIVVPDIANTVYNNTKAQTDSTVPTNVFMSNITPTGFQVNWITREVTKGTIAYGKTKTLNKTALDDRDSSTDVTRFTHSVEVTDASLVEGDKIYFEISSNSKLYGVNGGSSAYTFVAPKVLSSPPTPKALTGTLDYLSGSRLSSSKRDFVIYSKVKNTAGGLSTFVSTVPAYNSNGWSLSIGGARSADLSTEITPSSLSTLYVLGEYNSASSAEITDLTATAKVSVAPGLSVDSVKNGDQLAALSSLKGTATPSSNVDISLNRSSFTVSADSTGEWDTSLSSLRAGDYTLALNNSSQVLGLNFGLNLSQLPATGLSTGSLAIISGIAFVISGLALIFYVKRGLVKK